MLCGVTATLGSNPSATATAARPHWGRAVLLCLPDLWTRSLCVPVGGGPPARRPRRVLMLVAPLVFRAPEGPAAREARHPHFVRCCASKPARALRSLRRPPHLWVLRLKYRSGSPTMSHVIPLRLVQVLNSCRWNCNVFGWSRKMTEGNYVRNLSGPGLPPRAS